MEKKINNPTPETSQNFLQGLGVLFFEKMKEHSDRIGQIDAETGESSTYGEMLTRSIRLAQRMKEKGVTSDDVIVLCSYNNMECALPLIASLFLGAKIASLDPTLQQSDAQYLLNMVTPRMIFCDSDSIEMIENAVKELTLKPEIITYTQIKLYTPISKLLVSTGNEEEFKPKPVKDVYETVMIFFSSGTSGKPKGICTTHYGVIMQQLELLKQVDASVCLYFTTFYWISAVMTLILALCDGGRRIVAKPFNEKTAMKIIEKYKVTYCFIAPIHTFKLIKLYKSTDYDTTSLQSLVIGGGAVSEDQMSQIRQLFPHTAAQVCYGMTETSGCSTLFNAFTDKTLLEKYPTSTGLVINGFTLKVVNPETEKILGPNERGELRIKSKCLMNGYYKNPEESAKALDEDGYLYTGDLGYYNEDKCFYLVERIKDVMKYQSWHVVPLELESILLSHPDVHEATVVGKPHEIDGEHPTAFVVLKPGATVKEKDLMNYYEKNISGYERKKLHGGIIFVDKIPRTPSGKVQRRNLRAHFENLNL